MSKIYKKWSTQISEYIKYSICNFYEVPKEELSMHCLKHKIKCIYLVYKMFWEKYLLQYNMTVVFLKLDSSLK